MPSRKTASGEMQTDSRRSSLRRLSSIASFQTLFARRRSNNATDPTAHSSSSNLSLSSSTIANAPEPVVLQQKTDALAVVPAPPLSTNAASRRNSYVCLPDDPIDGMPRSRTFSNLPLPTKTKKTTPLIPSRSHARLPSTLLPSSRLPTPPASTRKHSHTRLASAGTNIPSIRNRVKRSDTEPLLPVNLEHVSNPPRPTAFKENISLSPVKPLPPMDLLSCDGHFSSSSSSATHPFEQNCQHVDAAEQPLLASNFSASLPYAQHPALRIVKENKSSPIYRSSRDRPATPGGSKSMDLQRWESQPILKDTTNTPRRTSTQQHREVKQTRLMSARQAPTPQPPKTPLSKPSSAMAKRKSLNNSGHIRKKSEQTPTTHPRSSPSKTPLASPDPPPLHQVSAPEPPSYWLGRLNALADRYRNEELASHIANSSPKPPAKIETDKMHTQEAGTARLRRAFEHLYAACATQEARESLTAFRLQYAGSTDCAELARPLASGKSGDEGGGDEGIESCGGMSEGRKMSFMDRLLGRQKRSSLLLV